ncbi:orotate phosphoribosyltransferase [Chryseobacterium indologenes]|uniref:Orotate phosphoribosyltransferase n=1 Tax=Chryseobacterium indologenes TaxID=253 RepID=A0A1Z3W4F0_CHRID|nr:MULTISPECIES: orotidine-5'-phosphate decarboxylase [Chryseobacterium]ASE62669.1 orotate phosphoribosyltransferase [Chryseobacterium indologenes]ATN06488.1 orotate phosphoribosyltransferase [Chryseobacterium indologenes]AYY84751.1 orotate phosphoribosyltransferase [Chryseobacterium indologenes]AYZ34438.1 orotate phosphoribosyltransferase [Chryseobacterium indologenes]AZB18363.1 orotate phosphoribosyltransferase [Chryseobacterium indologenes]
MESKKEFFLECYKLGIIKFGRFTLKSGIESPFYVDLRPLASDPKILKKLANYLLEMLPLDNFDLICGVPYAALPMATAMSLESYIPLIIKRKEAKSYGTKKLIEGIYQKGQNCLLVEDVITSGKSLLETIPEIEQEDLKVSDIVVVLDREQGGKQLLENKGYRVYTLFNISEVCDILQETGELSDEEVKRIQDFLQGNHIQFEEEIRPSYEQKLENAQHSVSKKLLEAALAKKSNLIASADVTTTQELLALAEKVGPHIVALKTHIDIISDFEYEKTIVPLKEIAAKHQFLLMEDRKFADIGNTQELQFTSGVFKITDWADFVTSQVIGGFESLDCFKNVGVVAIVGMSSKGTLTTANYREEALKVAISHPNVIGGVSQNKIPEDLLLFTPGVNLADSGDGKGQQYNTPEHVFKTLHTDFIIVGRGIYKSDDPEASAVTYKTEGWNAYINSLEKKAIQN